MSNCPTNTLKLCVSEEQAGEMLDLSATSIFNLRRAGRLKSIKIGTGKGCRRLYPISGLEEFVEQNSQVENPK